MAGLASRQPPREPYEEIVMKAKSSSAAAPAKPGSRQQRTATSYAGVDRHPEVKKLKGYARPRGLLFQLRKIGHIVLNCRDLERSIKFYTEVLGFEVSDVYPKEMTPGGMAFLRCNTDHHGIGLVGTLEGEASARDLNHLAFEVGTLDEVLLAAKRLREHGATIDFEGRRRAGVQIAVEFRDPDGHRLEIYWGIDQVKSDGEVRPSSEWKGAHGFREAIENPVRGQDTRLRDASLLDELDPTS
jgi:catechol 2,3-dioxygenase-like lactoylglutathione lyase family enzyme